MTCDKNPRRSALVFGARNLGRAVAEVLLERGWAVAAVATSDATLAEIEQAGALGFRGEVELVVNAAAPYGGDRAGAFGGGPLGEAAPDAFAAWAVAPAAAAFSFLSATGRFLVAQGSPATVVQVTGGSARRAIAGRGLWAAGSFGVRALTQAAALELREKGIHVALLIVDAGIERLSGAPPGQQPEALADPHELGEAVLFLAEQGARGATHELQVTPLAEHWVP